MKILQIIPNLSSGGAERLLVDLSNELALRTEIDKVTILTFIVKDPLNDLFYLNELSNRVEYVNIRFKGSIISFFLLFFKIYKLIIKLKPDIIHLHLVSSWMFSILAILFYRKPKYIQTLHNDAKIHRSKYLPKFFHKWLYQKFISIYSISKANEESFYKYYGFHTCKTIINGRNNLELSTNFINVKNEIEAYKINSETKVFLNIGRCHLQKNHIMLIEAFNRFIDDGFNAILLIIGNGFDSELGKQLQSIAKSNVYFLGQKTNVADYYSIADAFCLSSLYEGMPITLIESLYFGVTPISTPTSGANDICDKGVGFLSEDFSAHAFYRALVEFYIKSEEVDKNSLKLLYEKNFSIQNCADNYIKAYLSINHLL